MALWRKLFGGTEPESTRPSATSTPKDSPIRPVPAASPVPILSQEKPPKAGIAEGKSSVPPAISDIHEASEGGDLAKVERLLQDNPGLVSSKGDNGMTPLHVASSNGHSAIVELMLAKGAKVDVRNDFSEERFFVRPSGLMSALHFAARNGHKDVTRVLLANNAEVNAQASGKDTPLHFAAVYGHTDVAELLLAKGAKVNTNDSIGNTPLHNAAEHHQRSVAELLLANNAEINSRGHRGRTPLHCAVDPGWTVKSGSTEFVELLLANHADVDVRDEDGGTCWRTAALKGHWDCRTAYCQKDCVQRP
jgi:ankyrin repeat protein